MKICGGKADAAVRLAYARRRSVQKLAKMLLEQL